MIFWDMLCRGGLRPPADTMEHSCAGGPRPPLQRFFVVLAVCLCLTLTACAPKPQELSTTIFAMDTVMELAVFHDGANEELERVLQDGVESLYACEGLFSATKEGSDIHNINTNGGEKTAISPDTADVLEQALALCEKTGGALDITARPAVTAWGFTTGAYRVVSGDECAELAERIDYTAVELEKGAVTLREGMEIDLGAVAKGYVGDRLTEQFRTAGVTSALLNLGQSTIAAIGTNPHGEPWRIGIQDPHGESYLGVLSLNDQAMGSSGNYQRFFEENGVKYGHILDPKTAAPVHNDLAGVTVVADSALYCDGLSTALFVMGLEDAAGFWREHRDFEAIFIGEDGIITITPGLQGSFRLHIDQRNREVSVLE